MSRSAVPKAWTWTRTWAWAAGLAVLGGTVVPLAAATPATAQTRTVDYVTDVLADAVLVIDTATGARVGNPVPVGDAPVDVALTPDGSRAFVVNNASNNVSVIDTATHTVTGGPVAVGNSPTAVAVSPDGARVYVTNSGSDSVTVIGNTATPTVLTTITVGDAPQDVALGPDGRRAYVTDSGSDDVTVIDNTATPPVVTGTPLPVGRGPYGIIATTTPLATTKLYVTNSAAGTVTVLDTALGTVETVPVGGQPRGLAQATIPFGNRVYVANFGTDNVSVLQTNGANPPFVLATLPVGDQPQGVAVTPDSSRVHVTGTTSGTLSVIDNTLTPPAVVSTVTGLGTPVGLAIGTVPAPPGPQPQTPTTLTLKAKKKHKEQRPDVLVLRARLTAEDEPLSGKAVTFTTGSTRLCTDTTDADGLATCAVRGEQAAGGSRSGSSGKACYTARFAGDAIYVPSTATACRKDGHGTPRSPAGATRSE
ncbi:YncE family protein [Streptomyces sp. WAC06614]|uniref:YncE family protein n=1 Tax=Streptomyces sp. WAC06614 TaxID=2487416 RepID=UPI00163CFFB0|nr:YncE family protein [Streptomyces sp. WAC06614]